jgi:hypothetical protein
MAMMSDTAHTLKSNTFDKFLALRGTEYEYGTLTPAGGLVPSANLRRIRSVEGDTGGDDGGDGSDIPPDWNDWGDGGHGLVIGNPDDWTDGDLSSDLVDGTVVSFYGNSPGPQPALSPAQKKACDAAQWAGLIAAGYVLRGSSRSESAAPSVRPSAAASWHS